MSLLTNDELIGMLKSIMFDDEEKDERPVRPKRDYEYQHEVERETEHNE